MKKVYLSLLALTLLGTNSYAQDIDLQAYVLLGTSQVNPLTDTADRKNDDLAVLNRNQYFTPTPANAGTDSVFGVFGIFNNGPDVYETSQGPLVFLTPYAQFLTQHEFDSTKAAGGIDPSETYATTRYFWLNSAAPSNDVAPETNAAQFSRDKVGDISMLVDWDKHVTTDSIQFVGPPHNTFVDGTNYGFFMLIYGINDADAPANFDANNKNNFYMQKIQFNGGVGINAVDKEKQTLNAYPNPATSSLNIKFNYSQNTVAAVFVRDITGRVVKFQNYGTQSTGERVHNIDLSGLATGTYSVELSTGEVSATTKVVIK